MKQKSAFSSVIRVIGYTFALLAMLSSILVSLDDFGLSDSVSFLLRPLGFGLLVFVSVLYGLGAYLVTVNPKFEGKIDFGPRTIIRIVRNHLWWLLAVLPLTIAAVVFITASLSGAADEPRRISFILDNQPTHLGDNIFSTFGVHDPAQIPDPSAQKRTNMVFFNKATSQFEASALSTDQEAILSALTSTFSELDFSSYKHVRLVDKTELSALGLSPLPSPRVVAAGNGMFLIWDESKGNFHQPQASVLISYRVDLAALLNAKYVSSESYVIHNVHLAFQLTHGGTPQGEGGQILLVVNGYVSNLSDYFHHSEGQRLETVNVDITPWINLNSGESIIGISIVTTPIVENTPIPSPEFADPASRPVHFRDLMLDRVELWVDVTQRLR